MRQDGGLIKDTTGTVAVLVALVLPLFIGGLGLGTEVGYWRLTQAKLQNAADMAAHAAAAELRGGRTGGLTAAAEEAAEETGYLASRGTLIVDWPPRAGAFAADPAAVEVRLEERLPRIFSALFDQSEVPIDGRAVARLSDGAPTCILALSPTAPGALTFHGSAGATFVGCNAHSNSVAAGSAVVGGSSEVSTACLTTAGTATVSANLTLTECVAPHEHADVVPDPYADLPAPTAAASCQTSPANTSQTSLTISAGTFCSLDLKGTVRLDPGVYVLKGDLTINAQATVRGSGVTIHFDGVGRARFNGGATIQLEAPTAGAYAGVLLFGDRASGAVEHRINGNSSSFFNGAIYAPRSSVSFLGDGGAGGCTQIVAWTVAFSGNSRMNMDCTGWNFRDVRTARVITLVE